MSSDEPVSVKGRWLSTRAQFVGIGAFYVLVVAFFTLTSGFFFSVSNALNILSNITVIGIVALGQTLAIVSGGFDLSVSGVVPLGAVIFVIFCNADISTPLAVLFVLLASAVVGIFNGLLVTKVGINPLIATLGTLSITAGLAFALSNGVTIPLKNIDAGILAERFFKKIPYYVIALISLSVLIWFLMRYTVIGRRIYAIGGNREASRLAGIRVDEITIAIYATCAALAGFAGVVVSSQLLAGAATVGANAALTSIAAVILGGAALFGGVGGVGGTLLGVLVLGTIANGMALLMVPAFYQEIATGVILLLAVGLGRLRAAVAG
jgi:ribose transport system permease protein|tara:strand:- start:415 stop:1383 length:969 start_codon:yes stop_codon:yes gene_type:complete